MKKFKANFWARLFLSHYHNLQDYVSLTLSNNKLLSRKVGVNQIVYFYCTSQLGLYFAIDILEAVKPFVFSSITPESKGVFLNVHSWRKLKTQVSGIWQGFWVTVL